MGWGDDWQGEEPDTEELPPVAPTQKQVDAKPEYRPPRPESSAMEQWRLLGIRKGWRAPSGERVPPPELPKPVHHGYLRRGR